MHRGLTAYRWRWLTTKRPRQVPVNEGLDAATTRRANREKRLGWLGNGAFWRILARWHPQGKCPEPRATRGFAQRKRAWRLSRPLVLVEASTITSHYESMRCAAKRQKCPHRYPQMTSPGLLSRFRQILTLFRRSPRVESLQRIGAADQGARPSKPFYCALPLLIR